MSRKDSYDRSQIVSQDITFLVILIFSFFRWNRSWNKLWTDSLSSSNQALCWHCTVDRFTTLSSHLLEVAATFKPLLFDLHEERLISQLIPVENSNPFLSHITSRRTQLMMMPNKNTFPPLYAPWTRVDQFRIPPVCLADGLDVDFPPGWYRFVSHCSHRLLLLISDRDLNPWLKLQ